MRKLPIIILSLVLAIALGLGGCTTATPASPPAPPPNPPITVTLDRIGVYFDHDPFLKFEGDIYLGVVVTDGIKTQQLRLPIETEQHYLLNDNETQAIGVQVFSTNEVGDYLKVCIVAYESDGGDFEALMYQALGMAVETYATGSTGAGLLELFNVNLGDLLGTFFGSEDDFVGAYERTWTQGNSWGTGIYSDVPCEDLRLWFTIESPMKLPTPTTTPPPPSPTPTPTPTPTPEASLTAPKLVTPLDGATGVELRPRFVWKAVPGARGYELRVSQQPTDFSHNVISVSMGDTAYQLSPDLRYYQAQQYDTLTASTRYYWKVAAKMNPGDPIAWSPVWTFTTLQSED